MAAADKPVTANNIPEVALLVTLWVFFALATILLGLRFGIRIWLHRRLFWDDIWAGLAYILLVTHTFLVHFVAPSIYMMIGTYTSETRPADFLDQVTYLVRMMFSANIVYILCLYSVKASLLALLWRLVQKLPMFRKMWWGITVATVVFAITTIILAPVACSDLRAFGCTGPDHIKRDLITLRFTTATDILTDLLLMSLPVAFVLTSYLPWPQKLGLVGLFALGFTVISMSVLRIVANDNSSKHPPPAWLLFWSAMEASVAVMTSCFASFKSLFTLRKRPSAYNGSGYHDSSYFPGKSTHSRSDGDMNIALRSRSRYERAVPEGKNDLNTVVCEADSNKWDDGDSREEILQRTEFEVKYERASTPRQGSTASVGRQP